MSVFNDDEQMSQQSIKRQKFKMILKSNIEFIFSNSHVSCLLPQDLT